MPSLSPHREVQSVVCIRAVPCDDNGRDVISPLIRATKNYTCSHDSQYTSRITGHGYKRFDITYTSIVAAKLAVKKLRQDILNLFNEYGRPTVTLLDRIGGAPFSVYVKFSSSGEFDKDRPDVIDDIAKAYGELHPIMHTHFNNSKNGKIHSVFVNFAHFDSAVRFMCDSIDKKVYMHDNLLISKPQRNLAFVMSLVEELHEKYMYQFTLKWAEDFYQKHQKTLKTHDIETDVEYVLFCVRSHFEFDDALHLYYFKPLNHLRSKACLTRSATNVTPTRTFVNVLLTQGYVHGGGGDGAVGVVVDAADDVNDTYGKGDGGMPAYASIEHCSDDGVDDGFVGGVVDNVVDETFAYMSTEDGAKDGANDGAVDEILAYVSTEDGAEDGAVDDAEDGAEDSAEDGPEDGAEDGHEDGAEDGAGDGIEDGIEDCAENGAEDGMDGGNDTENTDCIESRENDGSFARSHYYSPENCMRQDAFNCAFWDLDRDGLCSFFLDHGLPIIGIQQALFDGADLKSIIFGTNAMQYLIAPTPYGIAFGHCLVYTIKLRNAVMKTYGVCLPEYEL